MTYKVEGTKELYPQFTSQKSFYGKANVETIIMDDVTMFKLYSYGTYVAFVAVPVGAPEKKFAYVFNLHSRTTQKHIVEFLLQHNLKAESGKQIMKDYHDKYLTVPDIE